MYYLTNYQSPVGLLTLACKEEESLAGLWIEGQKYFQRTISGETKMDHDRPIFVQARGWLDRYFAGEKPSVSELSLAPEGGEFWHLVWDCLCEIPYGQVITYGEIAKKTAEQMGKKTMSAQAVGRAVGRNPISIIIPCHRVVGKSGSLTGYSGGLEVKKTLLAHEGVDISRFFIPEINQ